MVMEDELEEEGEVMVMKDEIEESGEEELQLNVMNFNGLCEDYQDRLPSIKLQGTIGGVLVDVG